MDKNISADRIHSDKGVEITRDEINLLTLRRWHYEHPQEYADFTDTFQKAYDGDMTFISTNQSLLQEFLSSKGMRGVKDAVSSLFPDKKHDVQQIANDSTNPLGAHFSEMLDSALNKEAVREKLLSRNPYIFSLYYWLVFDEGFLHAADLLSKTFLKPESSYWDRLVGRWTVESLIRTSVDKGCYSKTQWKEISRKLKKGEYGQVIDAALEDVKGRHGRKKAYLLLEEMLVPEHISILTDEIGKMVAEWKRVENTDTILPYIFASLVKCELTNGSYSYRTFHTAMQEKFPKNNIGKGFDWAEAVYNAIVSESNYNASISNEQIERGQKKVEEMKLRLLIAINPNIE